MIKSMTGFGRGEYTDGKRLVTCEVKSVNHRYADISVKMSRRYGYAEDMIRKAVKEHIRRGKIEVGITVESFTDADTDITVNEALAGKYLEKLTALKKDLGLAGEITAPYLAGLPDVMRAASVTDNEEEISEAIMKAVEAALEAHSDMRAVEGAKLAEDLLARADLVLSYAASIEERGPELVREYTEKLRARIAELVDGIADVPEDRIALEAAVFADKSNITEELVRLRSHVAQLKSILASDDCEGKRLDFLIQEMNREANTIGSKANDLTITNTMLDIKGEVEKIREQVQNIE